jgi:hypothetical protein
MKNGIIIFSSNPPRKRGIFVPATVACDFFGSLLKIIAFYRWTCHKYVGLLFCDAIKPK